MIIADFSEGLSELTTEKLYQWDIGQQLQISGISAANGDMQVHFANPAMKQAIVKDGEYSGGVLTVDIPNEFLQVGGSVPGRAWLYCYDADSKAKTVKTIYIPIVARNRPNDYVSPEDPDSKGIVDRAMELLENYETDLAGKLSSAAGAVKTANIDTGAVTEAKLAADSVATAKIKDGSVTLAKLHSSVIDSTLSTQGAAEAKATGDAIKNFYGYSSGTELSANTDLNSVTTGGVYLIKSSVAASIQHSPFSSGGQILVVERTTPASGAYCRQKIYQGASGRAFYRHINTSSIWSDWIDIENEIETIESNISSIESDINGLEGEIEYVQKNAAYYFDFKNAQLINASSGAPSSNANQHTTDYISVKSGETIYYSLRGTSNTVGLLYLYDTSKVAVECIAAGAGSTVTISGSYTFEQNGYIRVCCRNDFLDQSKVFFKTSVEYNTVKIAELESGIDLSVVGKYKNQIENTYSLSDWKRGETTKRCLGLMMFSDLHGDVVRLQNAVQILNGVDSIDGAVFLGDMENSNQSSNMASKYIPEFQKADKPCFAVMGNHDMHHSKAMSSNSNTLEQSVDRFIGQLNNASAYSAHGYGYYDFSTYKVRLILLNDYEYPDVNDGTDWTYYGSGRLYQQGQIDWLINTLNSVPSDYTVIIAQHTAEPSVADNNVINTHYDAKNSSGYFHGVAATQSGGQDIIGNNGYMSDTVIADIITAYIGKTTLTKSYSYSTTSTGYTGISVSADFSSANGKFACLICGHNHAQAFCKLKGTIPVYVNDTSNCQYAWTTGYSLIPRNQDGVSGDLITVLCIDTDNKYLHFCRIGADRTIFGEKYDVVSVPYT